MISHSEIVPVSLEKVWEHLLFKIDNPQHFVPGVSEVTILEKTVGFTIRSMELTTPDGLKATVVERITSSPYLVKYMIIDHPVYEGYVDNLAEKISETETKITYTMNWFHKTSQSPVVNKELLKSAVLKTVEYIESM
jgi:hypothetical protein